MKGGIMKPQLIDIDYSYNNLKKYPKDELIALIWRNRSYIKQLEKALDIACEKLETRSYFDIKKEKWKESLLSLAEGVEE